MAILTREQYYILVNTKKQLNDNFTLAKSIDDTFEMFSTLCDLASMGLISAKDNRVKPGALEKYAWIDNGAAVANFAINEDARIAFEEAKKEYGESNNSRGTSEGKKSATVTGVMSSTDREMANRRAAKLVGREEFTVKVIEHVGERREYGQVGTQIMRGFTFNGSASEVMTTFLVKKAVVEDGVASCNRFIGRIITPIGLNKFIEDYNNKVATLLEFRNYECGFPVKLFGYAIVRWNTAVRPITATVKCAYNFNEMLSKFVDIKATVESIEACIPNMLASYNGEPVSVKVLHDGTMMMAIEKQKEILTQNRAERQQFNRDLEVSAIEAKKQEELKKEKQRLKREEDKARAERAKQRKAEREAKMAAAADEGISEERKRELEEMIANMTPEERAALLASYKAN